MPVQTIKTLWESFTAKAKPLFCCWLVLKEGWRLHKFEKNRLLCRAERSHDTGLNFKSPELLPQIVGHRMKQISGVYWGACQGLFPGSFPTCNSVSSHMTSTVASDCALAYLLCAAHKNIKTDAGHSALQTANTCRVWQHLCIWPLSHKVWELSDRKQTAYRWIHSFQGLFFI